MRAKLTLTLLGAWLIILGGILDAHPARAAAPVCARVKIEILQQLALERLAFDARLVINNAMPDQNLDGLSVNLQIMDEAGTDVGSRFFVKVSSLDSVSAVDGTGSVPPSAAAEVHWTLIPAPGAGGNSALGVKYFVGGEVGFSVGGAPQKMTLIPSMITVRPQPELELDYFLPREVWADDPFTDAVEAPVPFSLGVRTSNVGFGPAANLTINSGQPKIVENKQGLLIDFRLLGSAVNDQAVSPTLNLNLGSIPAQSCATGRWDMVTTLSGKFIDFKASFSHASELGGTLTSLIQKVTAHFLSHEMLVDLPGSDKVRDYLSYDDPNGNRMPDTIYSSDCRKFPVNPVAGTMTGAPTPGNPSVALTTDLVTGWSFTKLPDPAQGKLKLTKVVRSDGKRVHPNNAWLSEEKQNGKQSEPSLYYLNLVDYDSTGSFTVTYETPALDTTAPTTSLVVDEPKYGNDPVYVTSGTNFMFSASDDLSGVAAMVYGIDGGGYQPGLPFNLKRVILPPQTLAGAHAISYYSTDRSGNQESPKSLNVVVDDAPPAIASLAAQPSAITPSAPASSVLPRQSLLTARVSDLISPVLARYEVAAGSAASDQEFAALRVVRTLSGSLNSGTAGSVLWNGRDEAGNPVPAGGYTVRLTATDQLGQAATAFIQVSASEFLSANALAATSADQINPVLSGSRVAWQDYRSNKWDIYLRDLSSGSVGNLTEGTLADQVNPALDGDYAAWQDLSAGNWDIVLFHIPSGTRTVVASGLSDEINPVLRGNWLAYQAKSGATWDIYLYNIASRETKRITADPRDQINPVLSDTLLAWEDYRNGLGDIYAYDLAGGVEKQITANIDNQTRPTLSSGSIAWLDARDGNRELYGYDIATGLTSRLSYSASDEAQPRLAGGNLVYVDHASGSGDPNLSLLNLATRRGLRLISEPHRQEKPSLENGRLVWQDNRSGVWQIYFSELTLPPTVASYPLAAGFNLVAVTPALKAQYGSLSGLLSAWQGSGVTRVEAWDPVAKTMVRLERGAGGAPQGSDLSLVENAALFVDSDSAGELNLGEIASCGALSFAAGLNLVSFPCLPDGYRGSDLLKSLGSAGLSVSRFDNVSGRWIAVGSKESTQGGEDFAIRPGEGYLVYTGAAVPNWAP